MSAALALMTVLTLAPAQLELKNVRTTVGVLGQERKDDKLLPGDVLVVAFDIEGLKVKDDGRVLYAMGMELTKAGKDKPEFKRDPQDLEAVNSLGGTSLPAFALSVIGTDTAPGQYNLKVTVRDRQGKTEKTLNKAFEVLPVDLGFVQVRFTSSAGEPAAAVAVPGQRLYLHCALVGFQLSKEKLPHVTFEMQVMDESGKPTLEKPFKGDIKTDLKNTPGMMTFLPIPLELNRTGKFKVAIKAKDNIGGKTTEQALDLTVLAR
ncbi:MAG: hypothetical protein U0736_17865 [Gemmataceae bacterium]